MVRHTKAYTVYSSLCSIVLENDVSVTILHHCDRHATQPVTDDEVSQAARLADGGVDSALLEPDTAQLRRETCEYHDPATHTAQVCKDNNNNFSCVWNCRKQWHSITNQLNFYKRKLMLFQANSVYDFPTNGGL